MTKRGERNDCGLSLIYPKKEGKRDYARNHVMDKGHLMSASV